MQTAKNINAFNTPKTGEKPMPEKAKSFSHVIATLEGGAFNEKLSHEVQELIGDMENHAMIFGGNAKGKVTLSFDFTLKNGVYEVTGDRKISAPKEKKFQSIFWADKDNNLTEENPRQSRLDLGDKVERMPR